MNWRLPNDSTAPVITAKRHIESEHIGASQACVLPATCVIFEMGGALECIEANYEAIVLAEKLPCFIAECRCIAIKGNPGVCFTKGGYGAPAAVDVLETLIALGVKHIIIAGMCGGFGKDINVGDVVVPHKILCEEGTSRHYFESIEFAIPDDELYNRAAHHFAKAFPASNDATVTSDSFYRQTFAKEAYWRERGCVGVDMEASALLAVSSYYSIPAACALLCSDKHPLSDAAGEWGWGKADFKDTRHAFIKHTVKLALDS